MRRMPLLLLAAGLAGPCPPAFAETVIDVPLFRAASHPTQQSFVRISAVGERGTVRIHAYDERGMLRSQSVEIEARATLGFNSHDLEQGNPAKGLSPGIGAGTGDWHLQLRGDVDFKVGSYLRTSDGFLTAMGSVLLPFDAASVGLTGDGCAFEASIFNPARNTRQRSWLRLVNYDVRTAAVEVRGIDDGGNQRGPVTVRVPPGEARSVTAVELERGGVGLEGALGDGRGKWRLTLYSESPLTVMNLLEAPTGHLTNLGPAAMPGFSDATRHLSDLNEALCDFAPPFVIAREQ